MENQVASNDKENVNPVSNVPQAEVPKIYTIESEFHAGNIKPFTFL